MKRADQRPQGKGWRVAIPSSPLLWENWNAPRRRGKLLNDSSNLREAQFLSQLTASAKRNARCFSTEQLSPTKQGVQG